MHSVSSNSKKPKLGKVIRRPPQQERSERTLAAILDVASGLFGEVGFEATTMAAIAARSNTSIGGLYHYFPDKNSIVLALLPQSDRAFETVWKSLIVQAPGLTPQKFADLFIETILRLAPHQPFFLVFA